ncbi:MAG: hypothetical protein HYU69_10710 [Bacteroidetes bacterium]|nr:hypothetical protein [Bacteroidota bacterium]
MLSIQGIYDGKKLKLSEKIDVHTPKKVIVTFLEEEGWNEESLRNFSAQTNGLEFWENEQENIYQDYLKPKHKRK